jgi:hypothetical protein
VAAGAEPAVPDDEAARQELVAAYQALNTASYRVHGSGIFTQGAATVPITLEMEVLPPNRVHITIQFEIGGHRLGFEAIAVGEDSWFRRVTDAGPELWECNPIRPDPAAVNPDVNPFVHTLGVVHIARGTNMVIDGTQVRTYFITGEGPDLMRSDRTVTYEPGTTMFVDGQTGLPRRLVLETRGSTGLSSEMTMDYSDYGAPITIDSQSCS